MKSSHNFLIFSLYLFLKFELQFYTLKAYRSLSSSLFLTPVDVLHIYWHTTARRTEHSPLSLQVWFQNRRAKWRRQEKLEVSSIKLQDTSSSLLSFSRSPTSTLGAGLQLDPWLSTPLTTSTSLQSLPGFIGGSQGLPGTYTPSPPPSMPPSLPTSFLNSPALGHSPHLPHIGSMCPPPPAYQCSADPRNSSIASLRMKAKEHIQSIGKTWWYWEDVAVDFKIQTQL